MKKLKISLRERKRDRAVEKLMPPTFMRHDGTKSFIITVVGIEESRGTLIDIDNMELVMMASDNRREESERG